MAPVQASGTYALVVSVHEHAPKRNAIIAEFAPA